MALAPSELMRGLSHPSIIVRDALMDYFTSSLCEDRIVTSAAIAAVEQYGWRDFVFWPHRFALLPLNYETLPWVIEQIGRTDQGRPTDETREHLRTMLTNVPLEMIANRGTWLLETVPFTSDERKRIQSRMDLVGVAPETCWRRLVKFCKTLAGDETADAAELARARLLLEPVARAGYLFESRILEILSRENLAEDDALAWLTGFMLILAGEIRLDRAVQLIYGKFRLDRDWYSEEALTALNRIRSPRVIRLLRERYASEPWFVRNYVVGVLESIHSAEALQAILALIDLEKDDFLRGQLGYALTRQFDARTADRSRELYWESPDDLNRGEIRNVLVALSYLDDYALPERDEWESQILVERQEFERHLSRC
jgi:hypothetical protein